MKKGIVLTASVMALSLGAFFVAKTYAKYVSTVTGTGTTQVAKWSFDTDNPSANFAFNMLNTAETTTLVANHVAPGSFGTFGTSISNANTEVGIDVSLTVSAENGTLPNNLQFYIVPDVTDCTGTTAPTSESECTAAGGTWTTSCAAPDTIDVKWCLSTGGSYADKVALTLGTAKTGQIEAGSALSSNVVWEWPYYVDSTEDAEDTSTGIAAVGTDTTINVSLTGTQRRPGVATSTGWAE